MLSGTSTATTNTTPAMSSTSASCANVPTSKGGSTPLGGQNINKILDFIEGNEIDEAKHAKKAAKKARQKQKKVCSEILFSQRFSEFIWKLPVMIVCKFVFDSKKYFLESVLGA